jgi:uridine kinase
MASPPDRVERYASLVAQLRRLPRESRTVLVGIDGHGGAGKSTFAAGLASASPDVQVVHIDDFGYLEGYPNPDWARLQTQVLAPLHQDQPARYQRRDWISGTLAEWHLVPPGGIVVVEGVGAFRQEIRAAYHFRIWVDTPRLVCLRRGLRRDGAHTRDQWEGWLATEETYFREHQPQAAVDLWVDGAGLVPLAVATEYVRAEGAPPLAGG